MVVRACTRCKEYVVVNSSDPSNQRIIKVFEGNHSGHPVVSMSVSEVKDYYENVGNAIAEGL